MSANPTTPTPAVIETHYLEPRLNPETRSTLAELHTTKEALFKFRHAGFIVGNTLTEKVIYDLGQVIKRNFVDQKYNLNGDATRPMTDRGAEENQLITAAQRLLDKLFFVESLINAEETSTNKIALRDAMRAYRDELAAFKTSGLPLARQLASAVDGRKGRVTDTNQLSFERTGEKSLGEELQKEVRFLLHCVKSTNWLHAKRNRNAFAGAVGSASKQALATVAKHEFPLTDQPTSSLIFEAPSSAGAPQKVKLLLDENFIQNPQDLKDLVRMQRFANRLNYGEKPSTLPPLGKIKSNPLNPSLVWRRRNDIDHPTNSKGKAKFVGFMGLRAGATLADNLGGLLTGVAKRNFEFFRRREAKIRYSKEPDSTSPEHREWKLIREITHPKTAFNTASESAATMGTLSLSAVAYTGKALVDDGISLATNNALAQRLRHKADLSPADAETDAMRILDALQARITRQTPSPPQILPLPGSSPETEISPPHAPDVYQADDLLNLIADMGQKVTSDLNLFMAENPTIALLMTVTMGITLAPTPLKTLLKGLLGELHLDYLAKEAASFLPKGMPRDFVEKTILSALAAKIHVSNISSLTDIDLSELLDFKSFSGPFQENPLFRTVPMESKESFAMNPTETQAAQRIQPGTFNLVLWKTLLCYDHLPSLSQIQKDDLCRALLTLYPDHPDFTDQVIRQCQKTGDITLGRVTLPQSPLSASLTQAVHHATNAVAIVGGIPGQILRGEADPLLKAQTKALFEKSGLAVGTAVGTVVDAGARTATGALGLIPKVTDQIISTTSALTPDALKSSTPKSEADIVKDITKRAQFSNAPDQSTATLGKRIKNFFRLNKLQKKHQGRSMVIDAALDANSQRSSTPTSTSSTSVTSTRGGSTPTTPTTPASPVSMINPMHFPTALPNPVPRRQSATATSASTLSSSRVSLRRTTPIPAPPPPLPGSPTTSMINPMYFATALRSPVPTRQPGTAAPASTLSRSRVSLRTTPSPAATPPLGSATTPVPPQNLSNIASVFLPASGQTNRSPASVAQPGSSSP